MAAITARNGSPPANAAAATTPNSDPRTSAMNAIPIRSMSGRGRDSRSGAGWGSAMSGTTVQLEVAGHELAGEGGRALAAATATFDEHGDRDPGVVDRGEPHEPRVRLAAAPELRGAALAGG